MIFDKVFISSDHNGNAARAYITEFLINIGIDAANIGPPFDTKIDYPDEAINVCKNVLNGKNHAGILICGTGTGMLIAANRLKGIRAGLATDRATAELMRKHNNCNVLVLGQWRTPLGSMDEILKSFFTTPFENGRHIKRVIRLDNINDEVNK